MGLGATVAITTVIWLAVTWLTPATDRTVLHSFYRSVRPPGPGWVAVRHECGDLAPKGDLSLAFTGVLGGCLCVYAALFGMGYWLMGHTAWALACLAALVAGTVLLQQVLRRLWAR
jgi:hypothetical protein